MSDRGWFADLADEEERNPRWPWQPFIQITGSCLPLPVWFETEAECLDFIRTDIVGRGLLDQ
jgi:hypothetical protein